LPLREGAHLVWSAGVCHPASLAGRAVRNIKS
jgi:hypothetical protein